MLYISNYLVCIKGRMEKEKCMQVIEGGEARHFWQMWAFALLSRAKRDYESILTSMFKCFNTCKDWQKDYGGITAKVWTAGSWQWPAMWPDMNEGPSHLQ